MNENLGGTEVARIVTSVLDRLETLADAGDAPIEFRLEDVMAWSGVEEVGSDLMAAISHMTNGRAPVATLAYEVAEEDGTRRRLDGQARREAHAAGHAPEDRTYLIWTVRPDAFAHPDTSPASGP